MNPLKPCGACLEWLKKIAEVNPHFSVITFATGSCDGLFVEEVSAVKILVLTVIDKLL